MNPNILAVILSFVMVFLVIGIAEVLKKYKLVNDEQSRKVIHIGVSNWWFLMLHLFDNLYLAIIPPIVFIILNYVSYKTNLIKSMERNNNGNLGTVYFPIALLVLVIASFTITTPLVGGIGILVLGYGDGFAAVIGKQFGKNKLFQNKTYAGTITMFLISLIVTTILLALYSSIGIPYIILIGLSVAVVATLTELFTPKGLDNLTIPFIVSTAVYLLLMVI